MSAEFFRSLHDMSECGGDRVFKAGTYYRLLSKDSYGRYWVMPMTANPNEPNAGVYQSVSVVAPASYFEPVEVKS